MEEFIMDKNIVCVNLRNMEIFDHIREGETKKDLLARAYEYRDADILSCESALICYNCDDLPGVYHKRIKELHSTEFKVMSQDEYNQMVEKQL